MVQFSKQVLVTAAVLAVVQAHPWGSFHFGSLNPASAVKRTLFGLGDITDQNRKDKLTQAHKDAVIIADKALTKMDDPNGKYDGALKYWFGDKHTKKESKDKIRAVFKGFVGDNTDGTGSETNGKTSVYKDDYWVPEDGFGGGVGDGKTSFCNLKGKNGKTPSAYFKRHDGGAAMHFCDKVFDQNRANLDTLKANNCEKVGDQVSTKKWTKNFLGANVLHEFMHNPLIGKNAVLKAVDDFAYDAYQCHQLATNTDKPDPKRKTGVDEMRELTIRNADTYVWFALDIAFQEICGKTAFQEPVDESDDDGAADGDEPDSDPDNDDKATNECVCGESGCSNDSRPCCANASCIPYED